MYSRGHRCLKLMNTSRAFCMGEDTSSSVRLSGEIKINTYFTIFFACKNKVQLPVSPVLRQHFPLRRCETHLALDLKLATYFNLQSVVRNRPYISFLFEQILILLLSHEYRTTSIIISITSLKKKGRRGQTERTPLLVNQGEG